MLHIHCHQRKNEKNVIHDCHFPLGIPGTKFTPITRLSPTKRPQAAARMVFDTRNPKRVHHKIIRYGIGLVMTYLFCFVVSMKQRRMGRPGLEPGADRLKADCSTAELTPHSVVLIFGTLQLFNVYQGSETFEKSRNTTVLPFTLRHWSQCW